MLTVGRSVAFAAALSLAVPLVVSAATLTISPHPFTQATCRGSSTTNHHTEVEPDTFSSGSSIVAAFQVGRIFDGGACANAFAISTNNGASWDQRVAARRYQVGRWWPERP
jgi:hypothetical protein